MLINQENILILFIYFKTLILGSWNTVISNAAAIHLEFLEFCFLFINITKYLEVISCKYLFSFHYGHIPQKSHYVLLSKLIVLSLENIFEPKMSIMFSFCSLHIDTLCC